MTREDAKVFMRKEWRECMKGSFAESAFEIAIEALEQPERKKGKWITDKYGNVLCSECNWCAPQTMTGCLANRHLDYEKSDFCWHCGADMREDGAANADVES